MAIKSPPTRMPMMSMMMGSKQAAEAIHRVLNLFLVEIRHLGQHVFQDPGFLTDGGHLHDHVGKQASPVYGDSSMYSWSL